MTYLANILEHKKKNKLIELFGNDHYKVLYSDVKDQNIPFYKWHKWVRQELNDSLIRRRIRRRSETFGFIKQLGKGSFLKKTE